MDAVKNIVMVLSGKGGVGKSSVAVQVGLLDVDLCGPSIPRMLNLTGKRVTQGETGWTPVKISDGLGHEISVMSIAFLLPNPDDSIVWRAMIQRFLFNVAWGELDYLVIDTPPGTSDEHLALVEALATLHPKAIMVTTPQLVALADVEREIGFCRQVNLAIVGLVENMSGYVCPHCAHCTNILSSEGGRQLALKHDIPFLGQIPIFPPLGRLLESDMSRILLDYPQQCPTIYNLFLDILGKINIL